VIYLKVFDAIQRRYSVRRYEEKSIPKKQILKVLEAARVAPSASNRQPWHFIIVTDKKKMKKIAQSGRYARFIDKAPALIVGCGDHTISPKWYPVDVTIAMEHMVLEAEELGLGTCWVGSFNKNTVKELLRIPEKFTIVALLPIGYPEKNKKPQEKLVNTQHLRKKLKEIVSFEEYNIKST
jgi:nitroreductase